MLWLEGRHALATPQWLRLELSRDCEHGGSVLWLVTAKKRIELVAFSSPIVLPLYETTDQRLPPAAGVTGSTAVAACLNATVQGSRLLEPHSFSAVTFKVDEKFAPLRDLMLKPDNERFVPTVVDRHKVVIDGGQTRPPPPMQALPASQLVPSRNIFPDICPYSLSTDPPPKKYRPKYLPPIFEVFSFVVLPVSF